MNYDVIIIGAGVSGCAIAYELSKYRLSVLLVEKENDVADATTKANSGIVHAGYDPAEGTLMAKYNVRGCALISQLCEALDVPYRQTGSLVLGYDEADATTIDKLYRRGLANGVPGLSVISGDEVRKMEPNVSEAVICALYAPTAGVVSPWELALALGETAVRNGVTVRLNCEVTGVTRRNGRFLVKTSGGDFEGTFVVNAAGVAAAQICGLVAEPKFAIRPNKGEYYLLDKSQSGLTQTVLFMCPNKNGKGVLVSPTAHGNIIVGPNAQDCASDDHATSPSGLAFVRSESAKIIRDINFRDNIRNFAGVRANSDQSDFIIGEEPDCPGFINVAGIKSPGLTSAPAVAEGVAELLQQLGLTLNAKSDFIGTRKVTRFRRMTDAERAELIARSPAYGRVICRCETITEGEILAALDSPIPPTTVDAVKRRCGTGMGRCQGGFCGPRVHELLARHLGADPADVAQDKTGSYILIGRTKGEKA